MGILLQVGIVWEFQSRLYRVGERKNMRVSFFFFESVFGEFRGPISSNILYLAMFPVLLQDFFDA